MRNSLPLESRVSAAIKNSFPKGMSSRISFATLGTVIRVRCSLDFRVCRSTRRVRFYNATHSGALHLHREAACTVNGIGNEGPAVACRIERSKVEKAATGRPLGAAQLESPEALPQTGTRSCEPPQW